MLGYRLPGCLRSGERGGGCLIVSIDYFIVLAFVLDIVNKNRRPKSLFYSFRQLLKMDPVDPCHFKQTPWIRMCWLKYQEEKLSGITSGTRCYSSFNQSMIICGADKNQFQLSILHTKEQSWRMYSPTSHLISCHVHIHQLLVYLLPSFPIEPLTNKPSRSCYPIRPTTLLPSGWEIDNWLRWTI